MERSARQQRAWLLHIGVFGLPHAVAVAVVVGRCLRDVLHQYGGPSDAPGWAVAWLGSASVTAITWARLATRWWRGGPAALRAASTAWWAGLLAGIVATAIGWVGLLRSIVHVDLLRGPFPAAAVLVLAGLPLLTCAAHLLWLRGRAT